MKFRNIISYLLILSLIVILTGCSAKPKTSNGDPLIDPVIKTWTEVVDGKEVKYMTIDGIMVHETDPAKQPQPKIITPGEPGCGEKMGTAPSDAVVLFDGTEDSMKNWVGTRPKHKENGWKLVDGAMQAQKVGSIQSKQKFGSCQFHIEWATPDVVKGDSQGRGNSGVFLMDYEVQILDSYNNITYPDGQAGALYGRSKPLVNACRPPGQWQTFDIIFHRPIFDKAGNVVKRATFTVLHNGVLVQDNLVLSGGTGWAGPHAATEYKAHPDELPILIQDHGNPIKVRNIWVRPLED